MTITTTCTILFAVHSTYHFLPIPFDCAIHDHVVLVILPYRYSTPFTTDVDGYYHSTTYRYRCILRYIPTIPDRPYRWCYHVDRWSCYILPSWPTFLPFGILHISHHFIQFSFDIHSILPFRYICCSLFYSVLFLLFDYTRYILHSHSRVTIWRRCRECSHCNYIRRLIVPLSVGTMHSTCLFVLPAAYRYTHGHLLHFPADVHSPPLWCILFVYRSTGSHSYRCHLFIPLLPTVITCHRVEDYRSVQFYRFLGVDAFAVTYLRLPAVCWSTRRYRFGGKRRWYRSYVVLPPLPVHSSTLHSDLRLRSTRYRALPLHSLRYYWYLPTFDAISHSPPRYDFILRFPYI